MFLIIHSGSFSVSYQLCSCQGSVWNDPSYKAGEGQPGLVLFGGPGCQTPPDKNPELLKRAQAGERLSLQHDIMVKALKCGSDSEHRGSNVLQGNNSRWVSCYSRITHTQGEVIQVCAHQGNLTERRINYFAIKGDKNTQTGIYWRTADVRQVHSLTELYLCLWVSAWRFSAQLLLWSSFPPMPRAVVVQPREAGRTWLKHAAGTGSWFLQWQLTHILFNWC